MEEPHVISSIFLFLVGLDMLFLFSLEIVKIVLLIIKNVCSYVKKLFRHI